MPTCLPAGQLLNWIDEGHLERCKVIAIAGDDGEIVSDGRGGDRHVGEARMTADRGCPVRQSAADPRCVGVERQNAIRTVVQKRIQPSCQSLGALAAACTTQLANALLHLGHGHRRDVQPVIILRKLGRQAGIRCWPTGRQQRQHRCVEQETRTQRSTSRSGVRSRSNSMPPGKDSSRLANDGRSAG